MLRYRWICHVCSASNDADVETCSTCGFPAIATGNEILRARKAAAGDSDSPPGLFQLLAGRIAAGSPFLASVEKRANATVVDAVLATIAALTLVLPAEKIGLPDAAPWIAGLVLFVGYQIYALRCLHGTGIGRMLSGVRVANGAIGRELTLFQCVARPLVRVAWWGGPALLAYYVLGEGRAAAVFYCAVVPLGLDLLLVQSLRSRQTMADLVCHTLVMKLPPLQPHRAPAAPMFSPTDAEFGLPLRSS